jgi:type IV pilus assembly protein PilQ
VVAAPQPVATPPPAVSKVLPPAKLLKKVRFERKEGLQLVITADGLLLPKPEMLDKNRLIIDLPQIKPAMKLATLPVSDPMVKQLRMGQHPDKIRLVLDLLAPVAYAFRQTDNDLIVYLRPATSDQKPETSQAPSLPPVVAVATVPPPPPPDLQIVKTEPAAAPNAPSPDESPVPVEGKSVIPPKEEVDFDATKPRYVGNKISMDFQDADVVNVLRLIGDVSGSNMVIGEDVKGKVNLKLENVPWDQALDIILKTHTLGQINEGNIIRVGSLVTMTQQQREEAKAKESREQAEDLETRIVAINYSKATDLSASVKKSLSPRGDITVDDRTNTLIVRDIPKNLLEVDSLARRLDTPTPQVTIEARIVQVAPSFNRSLGIQWGANYSDVYNANRFGIGSLTPSKQSFGAGVPDFAINLPASPTFGGVGFSFGRLTSNPFNLDLRLSAGESQGLTRVVSRPKVTVLDNQKAKIAQGEQIPFQTVSDKGTQTTFVDATLSLMVTPHISADGGVMMNIDITKDAPGAVVPGASGPSILKKSASTNVLVRDGETTVVGGIYEKSETEAEDGVPFLKKLPVVGWLFKTVQKRENISELLVFITPRIVKQDVAKDAPKE